MKNRSAAIIGAGLAGLSCAESLTQAGWTVRLFDKSRGAGGRMSTRRDEDWQCDHGAQYFTARDPAFAAEVARWQAADVAQRWSPRLVVIGDQDRHRPDPELVRYVGSPRMSAPARWLSQGLRIRHECRIRALLPQAGGWRIQTERGALEPDHFDVVILALPPAQAAELLQPVVPDLAALAYDVPMRPCWSLMLRYDQPLSLGFDAAFVNHGPLRWIAREASKPGRPQQETWLLHANAEWSESHVDCSPATVSLALQRAFTALGAPPTTRWTAHRWLYADCAAPLQQGCAWDAQHGVGLCGDWLHGGKVEGAWLSGRALARSILNAQPAGPSEDVLRACLVQA